MQKTIQKEVWIYGIGLHTGESTKICIKPAEIDNGVVFVCQDLKIRSDLKYIINTNRGVNLKRDNIEIKTIEHLLSALAGLGIDNVEVCVFGREIPAGDGSCLPFINAFKDIIVEQAQPKRIIKVSQPVWEVTEYSQIVILPDKQFKISYTISYDHPIVKSQFASFILNQQIFEKEIAPARTYGFINEVDALKSQGLAKGGSLENAIVISNDGYLNKDLRFENELVRHKILDLIGDLALLGKPLLGHVIAIKSSHSLNIKLARQICEINDFIEKINGSI